MTHQTVNLHGTTIIPKTLGKGDDLVVIPRKEYERLLAQEADDVVPPIILEYVPLSKLSKESLRKLRKAQRTPVSKMFNI